MIMSRMQTKWQANDNGFRTKTKQKNNFLMIESENGDACTPDKVKMTVQCALDILLSFFYLYNSRKTPHRSPVRAMYGVSFVSASLAEVLSL